MPNQVFDGEYGASVRADANGADDCLVAEVRGKRSCHIVPGRHAGFLGDKFFSARKLPLQREDESFCLFVCHANGQTALLCEGDFHFDSRAPVSGLKTCVGTQGVEAPVFNTKRAEPKAKRPPK